MTLRLQELFWEDESKKVIVPNPSFYLYGAIDNTDFNEETLSGKNTTHKTAIVVYQEQTYSQNESFVQIKHAAIDKNC